MTTGETITVSLDMPKENFHSRTLNRDFPVISFVTNRAREGEPLAAPAGRADAPAMVGSHDAPARVAPAVVAPVAPVAAPPGGISIADAWATGS